MLCSVCSSYFLTLQAGLPKYTYMFPSQLNLMSHVKTFYCCTRKHCYASQPAWVENVAESMMVSAIYVYYCQHSHWLLYRPGPAGDLSFSPTPMSFPPTLFFFSLAPLSLRPCPPVAYRDWDTCRPARMGGSLAGERW